MFYGQDHFVLRERTGGNVSMWTWIMCWGQRRALFCLITQHRHSHCTWRHKSGPVLVLWIQRSSENPALRLEPPGFWLDGAGVLVVPSAQTSEDRVPNPLLGDSKRQQLGLWHRLSTLTAAAPQCSSHLLSFGSPEPAWNIVLLQAVAIKEQVCKQSAGWKRGCLLNKVIIFPYGS